MEIFKHQRLFELENLEKKLLSNVAPAEAESRAHLVELGNSHHQEVEEEHGGDIPVFGDDDSSNDQKDNNGNQIKLYFLAAS